MIQLLRHLKLNFVFINRAIASLGSLQAFRAHWGAMGWWAPPAYLKPKCLNYPVALRANKFDYQVFAKVFVWGGYRNLVDRNTQFIIDAGSNIGLSVAYFARMAPQAVIVAIEPEGGNVEILQRNTATFGTRIRIVSQALTSGSRRLSLDDSKGRPDGYRFYDDASGEIAGITIDDLVQQEEWTGEIDLLKVDIEGGEYDLFLNGDLKWLGRVKYLVCEIHDRPDKKKLEDKILAEGFEIKRRGEDTHFTRKK